MDVEDDGGLLGIGLDDSDNAPGTEDTEAKNQKERVGQSEEQFQSVKTAYEPKFENGEVEPTARPFNNVAKRRADAKADLDHDQPATP
jgi:hypothetical protein